MPNPGHFALASLQQWFGHNCSLVTQNVDDLLERAGAQDVTHMHGSLFEVRCTNNPKHVYPWRGPVSDADRCEVCKARLRPNIVRFEEMPFWLDKIERALSTCTHFLAIGTSGKVYPAASFFDSAKASGAVLVNFNLLTDMSREWDYQFSGKSSETLPRLASAIVQTQRPVG